MNRELNKIPPGENKSDLEGSDQSVPGDINSTGSAQQRSNVMEMNTKTMIMVQLPKAHIPTSVYTHSSIT